MDLGFSASAVATLKAGTGGRAFGDRHSVESAGPFLQVVWSNTFLVLLGRGFTSEIKSKTIDFKTGSSWDSCNHKTLKGRMLWGIQQRRLLGHQFKPIESLS